MAYPPRPSLSAWEKLGLMMWAVLIMPVKLVFSVSRALIMAWGRGLPLAPYAACGFYRVVFRDLMANHVQAILPGTLETYHQWIKDVEAKAPGGRNGIVAHKLKEKIEPLSPTSCIMWLGNPATASKVVLYFHGGGYKAPLSPGQLDSCVQAFILSNPQVEVAVAVLQYTLAPARYPTQLSQAASALSHLLNSGFGPEDLIFGGDSCGGNLTAQLLSHLLHPHPDIDAIKLSRPLLGVFTISPWLSSRTDDESFRTNHGIDMLDAPVLKLGVMDLLTDSNFESERSQGKGWAMVMDVDESWLDGLDQVTHALYLSIGENEVFRSQDVAFGEIIRRRNPNVKLSMTVAQDEAHNFFFIEGERGVFGDSTRRLKNWTATLISQ